MPPVRLRAPLVIVGLLFFSAAAAAGDAPSAGALVQRLGDPSFSERERATATLRQLGRVAVPALEAGLISSDAEVRRRCAELLPLARRTDRQIEFDAFTAGESGATAPFPGWDNFRKFAGDDQPARELFIRLGQTDRPLLEALAEDPARVGARFADRSQVASSRRPARGATAMPVGETALAALLLTAACSKDRNTPAANQLFSTLYQPGMRALLRDSVAARRLLTPFLARQLDEPWRLHQSVWLARNLGLDEFIESTLKPEARKQAEAAAARPDDSGNLFQAATIVTLLDMRDTIEGTLKPAARKLADKLLERHGDVSQIMQAVNLLQTLKMQDAIDGSLRPAACLAIEAIARKAYDQYQFHMALNLARSLELKVAVDQVLRPAAVKALITLSQQMQKNPGHMYEAINLVQTFDLKEASEDFLKPAARRFATTAASTGDLTKLTQAAHLVTALNMTDTSEQTLRPAVSKLAAEPTTDANRVSQLVTVAQSLGMQKTIDDVLKPSAARTLLAAKDRPVSVNVQHQLQLARTLHLKEGVPLALKAGKAKDLSSWTRGSAVLFVAEFGGKEHVAELEPLLTDATSIGTMGFNFATIQTEVRDVALAAMVSLSGQQLEDYDFPYVKHFGGAARPLSSLSAHCYGFSDAANREAALKKWKERSAARK